MKIRGSIINIRIKKAMFIFILFVIGLAAVWDFKLQLYHFLQAETGTVLSNRAEINRLIFQLAIKLVFASLIGVLPIVWGRVFHNKKSGRADGYDKPLFSHKNTDMEEDNFHLNDERFRVALKASHAALFEIDLETKAFLHFDNAESITGISAKRIFEEMNTFAERSLLEYEAAVKERFFHPDDYDVIGASFETVFKGCSTHLEARMRREDGSFVWCKIDVGILAGENGASSHAVGYITDISSMKRRTELLESKAQIDPLTGLYNKATTTALADAILSSEKDGLHALIVLDIDNFKGVNDTLGHAFGDAVLMDVCAKLKALFRSDDIVGRIGGDEFAILMRNVPDTNRVLRKTAEIGRVFRRTYAGEQDNYKISCSMGIIMAEHNNDCFETLYPKADAALYQAKRSGKDMFVLYREEDAEKYSSENKRAHDAEPRCLNDQWNIEDRIFRLLFDAKHFSDSINMALALIGQQYQVSRAYIFENDRDNQYTSNIFEWCAPGITSEKENLQNIKISVGQVSILDCFDENGLFYCNDISTLPDFLKQILESQEIQSTLQMEIVNEGKIGGFIGVDECSGRRVWTVDEIDTLSFLSSILSIFLLKRKAETALAKTLESRLTILNSLPNYICVVNPVTHSIEYANDRMQELIPNIHSGALCYTSLRGGQNAPCKSCLVERIKRGDTDNLEIISENKGVHLSVKALYINWIDNKKMVLLYGQEKES